MQLAFTGLQNSDSATYRITMGMSFFLSLPVFPNFNGDSDNFFFFFFLKHSEFLNMCCHM